jgi:hypothetical protein
VITLFEILKDKTICLTRGDIANIEVSAKLQDGQLYTFHKGDVVRFSVYKKRGCDKVLIKKDQIVEEDTQTVTIHLTSDDTRIEGLIITPVDYWYEIEVNPETAPQTIVGYDAAGEKIFRLYPESGEA